MVRPITAMTVMTILPPFPKAKAYIWMNGCGASFSFPTLPGKDTPHTAISDTI